MSDEIDRAFAAYFRFKEPGQTMQPSHNASTVETIDGRGYVVLRSGDDVLAVYRITNRGVLRRMRRWPHELDAAA